MSGSQASDLEYEVDRILDHRKRGAKSEYLIRWKDYGAEEDSWEPVQNLAHCRDLVEHYNRLFLTPITPGSSSSTLSRLQTSINMPAKVRSRSRSRSSSRSRTSKTKASPSRSPSRRSSRTSTATKEVVTKRSGRSPARSSRSSASSLTRSPVKEASYTQRMASEFVEASSSGREATKLQQRQVLVERSWTSTSERSGIAEIRGRRNPRAIEMSDSEEEGAGNEKGEDEVDTDTKSWFGQKRREMLESLQSRSPAVERVRPSSQALALKDSSGWTFTTYRPMATLGLRRADIPIIVFVTCIIIIGVTFLIEEYF